jgi:hypothetical protein
MMAKEPPAPWIGRVLRGAHIEYDDALKAKIMRSARERDGLIIRE